MDNIPELPKGATPVFAPDLSDQYPPAQYFTEDYWFKFDEVGNVNATGRGTTVTWEKPPMKKVLVGYMLNDEFVGLNKLNKKEI
jgi:hypothetical protein